MKYLMIIISFIALNLFFNACEEDFLNRTPLDKVTEVDFFLQPNELKVYLNQFYNSVNFHIYVYWGNDFGTDNAFNIATRDSRLEGTRTIATSESINFSTVRAVNYFFDHYKKVKVNADIEDYKQYLGEAYFFRALIYFDLLKSYGDIQWYSSELRTDSPELYKKRDPRNIVAGNIIADLDTAAMYLTEKKTDGAGRVNKWIALLIQSRVALYEGSWEKYHANSPFSVSNPQPEKYFNKVVEATTKIMESGIYDIYSTGEPSMDYYNLYSTLRDYSSNTEVMFWRKYDNELSRGDFGSERNFIMVNPVGRTITKQLADSYLCTDGNPITGNPLFKGYTTLNDEKQNRDPRFFQTIATPDATWAIYADGSIDKFSKVYDLLNFGTAYSGPTGYIILKGYDSRKIYQIQINGEEPAIIYRYAEVLLNFAEAKAELGTIVQTDIDESIKKLRDRVGMPNLILADITIDPNWNFPDLSPTINEIRRERRIELALEGFRWDDIARWAAADELIVGKRPKGFLASQININPYSVDEDGFLDPIQVILPEGYGFKLNRDYLNSIPESEIVLNTNLKQNPGW